ncbi:glycosyltransferase family 4 protein [Rhizorhapis suberifaciens]|uniref:Glycosyltransferase involved in cell wall biosynthesis n=1 Tax=Rhizorhapis suberifaciens TaxID=13656 RepID=A0A840HTD1_9SPHN|nr:glycosyltransferase family 4 protein [Rhizorhapis suberifaciens]MBB4640961.1 glycosyltransferase involved in cell wall biosynthesis [Rhizorhapis suberifaciens]
MQIVLDERRLSARDGWYGRVAPLRIAYLTNVYPKVSHSFIRREIAALERQGFDVHRFSIRTSGETLPDPDDQSEATRTAVLLDGPRMRLFSALLWQSLRHPVRFAKTLALAVGSGLRGQAGIVRSAAYLVEACLLVRMLQNASIRHVHVHFGTNPAAVARLANKLAGITYSMTLHGPDEFDAPASLLLAEKIAGASFVVAVSDFGRGQLMRWAHIADWPKIKVVRCGLDRQLLDEEPSASSLPHSNVLVCVARLSSQKGLNLLIEAAAEVARDHLFSLRIVGDGEMRPQLEAQIKALGLERRVTLTGWKDAEAVRREILGARALILPSFAEGLPVVLMEALALGRPVVATCIAGVPELVDEQCGWLVPAGSRPALAEALREALECHPGRLACMAEIGRERVLRNHNGDRNAALLADLLRPLVGG